MCLESFLVICGRLSWLLSVLECTKYRYRIASYRNIHFLNVYTDHSSFYRASIYASAVLAVVILSVRPSVRHTRVLWQNYRWSTVDILIPHETAITLVSWHQQWLVGDAPFRLKSALKMTHPSEKCRNRQISAYNDSTVKRLWKSSIVANIKSTTSFQWAIDRVPTLPLSALKGGSKSR